LWVARRRRAGRVCACGALAVRRAARSTRTLGVGSVVSVVATGRVISNFALTHFSAAKHFSLKTNELEKAHAGQPFGNFWEEISIYCSSSIMTAAASLEALINELFLEPGALHNSVVDFDKFFWGGEVTKKTLFLCKRKALATGLEREPALKKYRKAALILSSSTLSKTDPQYMAAESLIGFRNYLVHFKPLWDEDRRNVQLEQRLVGLFQTSPFVESGASFLAMQCMSGGCSAWAVSTVVDFVKYFGQRTGVNPKKLGAFA
jgi:hypothetical protein